MAAWSCCPRERPLLLPLEIDAKTSSGPLSPIFFLCPSVYSGENHPWQNMWWQRKRESNASCQLSLPPTPHPYSRAPLLHNKLPQNLTAWNNHFFMLTNSVGQGFGQSTMKIVYVCSAISRISTGKTPQPRQTQQLGAESSGDTFAHISGGWCRLSTETSTRALQVPSPQSGLGFWPAQSSNSLSVPVNEVKATSRFSPSRENHEIFHRLQASHKPTQISGERT